MYPADIRHKDAGRSLGGPRWEHTCQLSESGWLRQTLRVSLGSILGWLHHHIRWVCPPSLASGVVVVTRSVLPVSTDIAGLAYPSVTISTTAPLLVSSPLPAVSSRSTGLGGWVNDTSRLHFHTPTTSAASSLTGPSCRPAR